MGIRVAFPDVLCYTVSNYGLRAKTQKQGDFYGLD